MNSFVVKKVEVALIRPLRQMVLRPGQALESAIFHDDDAPNTVHFAAVSDTDDIGCVASLYCKNSDGRWQLRGMATDPVRQGCGLGARVLDACVEYVRSERGHEIWCNARITAASFYEKAGFSRFAEPFDIPGIGLHFVMKRTL